MMEDLKRDVAQMQHDREEVSRNTYTEFTGDWMIEEDYDEKYKDKPLALRVPIDHPELRMKNPKMASGTSRS